MKHDDEEKSVTVTDIATAMRQGLEEMTELLADEMILLVMRADPHLASGTANNTETCVYAACHRLLIGGLGFNQRVMERITDKLGIVATLPY